MIQKNRRRLSRRELLETLLEVSRENERLKEQNSRLEELLKEKKVEISEAGSLAEAALQLNGVFQAAQAACDQYTLNIRLKCRQMEEETKNRCQQLAGEEQL